MLDKEKKLQAIYAAVSMFEEESGDNNLVYLMEQLGSLSQKTGRVARRLQDKKLSRKDFNKACDAASKELGDTVYALFYLMKKLAITWDELLDLAYESAKDHTQRFLKGSQA